MRHCQIDASNQEPAPGAITAALAGTPIAGNVDNGAHRYLATFVTADGETQAGTVSAAVTVADKTVNGKVSLTAIPLGGSLVTSRKLYRTAAGGSTYLLLATLANNTATTYTDNIADSSLGAGAPATNTTSDPDLTRLIIQARRAAERKTRCALITQTWDLSLDAFPSWELRVPKPPLQSVTSITYVDTDGVTQTLAADQYLVDIKSQPGLITPAYGLVWPSTRAQSNAVTIRFICGFGAAATVSDETKQWMLVRIKHQYDNRGPNATGIITDFPRPFVDGLLDGDEVLDFGWAE
jgi:uncharacterized phiE125 gp8 family phage protein